MKNKNGVILALACALGITSGGWAISFDLTNELQKIVVDRNNEVDRKSTEIAKLKDVIVKKDNDLIAKNTVIEKQKNQINKSDEKVKTLSGEVDSLNKKLKTQKQKSLELEKIKLNFSERKEGSDVDGRKVNVKMTAYTADCKEGCSGITATGVNVKNTVYHDGMRVIATDPNVIPLNSVVEVKVENGNSFKAVAIDTGGAIDGNKVDYLVDSTSEALEFGRKNATITVLKEGR